MNRFLAWDTPQRIDEPEWIDDERQPYGDLRASMLDVQRANTFLGGTSVVTRQTAVWLRAAKAHPASPAEPVTFLDVATGSGDLPRAILRTALREGVAVRVAALDYSAAILRCANEVVGAEPNLRLLRGTAFRLPFKDSSVDYVLCSLAFHHFGFDGCIAALSEMERVSRRGWLVNDLRRARSAWFLFRAISTITRMNRLTQHDGPASILRSYTLSEYHAMPGALGLHAGVDYNLRRSPFYRVAITRDKAV